MSVEVTPQRELAASPLALRYHHLEWLSAFTLSLYEDFGVLPWELQVNEKIYLERYARSFSAVALEPMTVSLTKKPNLFSNSMLTSYYKDVLGDTLESATETINKNGDFLSEMTVGFMTNPNGFLKLTEERDGICKSCAIGKHCKTNIPLVARPLGDGDFIVKQSLLSLRKRKPQEDYGALIIPMEGDILLANKIIFKKDFYINLTREIKRKFLTSVDFGYWNKLK